MTVSVSQQSLVVHHTGRLKASVSSLAMTVHHASKTTVRTSVIAMAVHHTDHHAPIPVASVAMAVHHTDEHKPIPVAGTVMVVHRTLGYYLHCPPLAVEPEAGFEHVRVKVFGGPMMRQAYFNVLLSHAHSRPVSVDWTTVPGTALPPGEYDTMSGTLTFLAGEVSKIIVVPVREFDADVTDHFTILLSSPINATIADAVGIANI